MFGVPEYLKDTLVDPLNHALYGVSQSKLGEFRIEPGIVAKYYPLTHTADVRLARAGLHDKECVITVKVQEQYQGPVPGTGDAAACYKGQQVNVAFLMGSATGVINHGVIVGTKYTHKDHHAVAYAPFQASGTGKATVHPTRDGKWGNAEHVDAESNVSRTTVGKTNTEDWGNEHTVVNGPNITRSEELTRRASKGMGSAATRLGQ